MRHEDCRLAFVRLDGPRDLVDRKREPANRVQDDVKLRTAWHLRDRRHEILQVVRANHGVEEPLLPCLPFVLVTVDEADDMRPALGLERVDDLVRGSACRRAQDLGLARRKGSPAESVAPGLTGRFAEQRLPEISRTSTTGPGTQIPVRLVA
jgi:hypothetical protein